MRVDHKEAIAVGESIVILYCNGKPNHLQGTHRLVACKVNGTIVWRHKNLTEKV